MLAKDIPEIKLSYLAQNENASCREVIFNNKFKYDFQIAYAEYGRFLHIYERDIDRDSTDFILEGSGFVHRVQLKTIIEDSKDLKSLKRHESSTKYWKVFSKFIKPELANMDILNVKCDLDVPLNTIEPDGPELGYGGSIILQRVHYSPDDSVTVRYSIFNMTILAMAASDVFETHFFNKKGDNKRRDTKQFFDKVLCSTSPKTHVGRRWFVDFENDILSYIGSMGIPVPEAPHGILYYLEQCRKSKCSESYFRIQCIVKNNFLRDQIAK